MKRVLLTCARIPTALFLTRALHKIGAEVHVADSFQVHLCKATNSVHTCHKTVSPVEDKATYKQQILEIIDKYKIDLVVPVFEEGIYLSEFYDEIASKCKVALSKIDLLLQLHNKSDFIKLADSLGLATPTTYIYDSETDHMDFIQNTKYIVKKIYSRAGNGFAMFEAGEQLSSELQPNGEYIIQEFIAGQLICTCSYVYNGKLLLHTAYKQLIVTPNGTAAVCFQAIEDQQIQDSITKFVAQIGYNGWISFDIIQKPNGEGVFIECNPRTSLGIYLFDQKMLAKTLLTASSEMEFQEAANIGSKAQMVLISIECILRRLLRGKTQLSEVKSLFSAKDLTFDLFDLYPFMYQFACYVYVKKIALKLRTSIFYAATRDLEWN